MTIPTKIKYHYVPSRAGMIMECLKIEVGKDFDLQCGDTLVIFPKKAQKLEIERKKTSIPKDFDPYYAKS